MPEPRWLEAMPARPAREQAKRWATSLVGLFAERPVEPTLRVLTYHRVNASHPGDRLTVSPAAFALQMEYLKASGRPVLAVPEAVAALSASTLPARAVALTFDDGYRDNLQEAAPVLDRLGLHASFFVVSGHVGTRLTIDRYRGCCDDDVSLDWDEVRELNARGHDVGGHGRTHRELAGVPPRDLESEVAGCRAEIADNLGVAPALFCYPRGSEDPAARRAVREAGHAGAFTVYPGPNRPGVDAFGLTRTEVSGTDDLDTFAAKLDGRHDAWHRLVQRLGGLRHGRPGVTAA